MVELHDRLFRLHHGLPANSINAAASGQGITEAKAGRGATRTAVLLLAVFITGLIAPGWGWVGHRFINTKAVYHLPPSMSAFIADSTFFGIHGPDADNRKGSDTSESPKHFIDIENYPDYAGLHGGLDSLITLYGWEWVKATGILPWATVRAYDSLVAQLGRGDQTDALQTASDLGHYVGDGHMPLHITVNYDGKLTGNNGIHSRYESEMIRRDSSQLAVSASTAIYVENRFSFVMDYLLSSHAFVDSIFAADNDARTASGWNGSGQPPDMYYSVLWNRSRAFTLHLMQTATQDLANLWFSANIDAGTIPPVQLVSFTGNPLGTNGVALSWSTHGEVRNSGFDVQRSIEPDTGFAAINRALVPGHGTTGDPFDYSYIDTTAGWGTRYYRLKQIQLNGAARFTKVIRVDVLASVASTVPAGPALYQNFPNPFNPVTIIRYRLSHPVQVQLAVYDLLGRQVAQLVGERQSAGVHEVTFHAAGLPSATYFYSLRAGAFVQTKKLLLMR